MEPGPGNAPPNKKAAPRKLSLAAAAMATACIYAALFLAYGIQWKSLALAWRSADKAILAGTLVFSVCFHVFVGADKLFRVLTQLKPLGFDLTYGEVLRLRLGAGPLRTLLPVDAGEIFNILYYWRHKKVGVDFASGASVFDRGLNLIGSTFWLVLGILLLRTYSFEAKLMTCLLLGTVYGFFFFATPLHAACVRAAGSVHASLGRFVAGVLAPLGQCTARNKLFFCAYGVFFQARPLVVCYLLFSAFGLSPEPASFIALVSLAIFAGHLPTAAGMGPREAVIMLSFSSIAPAGTLLTIGILQSLFIHIIPMLAGMPWMLWFLRRMSGREKAA